MFLVDEEMMVHSKLSYLRAHLQRFLSKANRLGSGFHSNDATNLYSLTDKSRKHGFEYTFSHFPRFFIQHSTANESVQNVALVHSISAHLILSTRRAKINAPSNSRREIVWVFKGATLDFDATNLTSISPFS